MKLLYIKLLLMLFSGVALIFVTGAGAQESKYKLGRPQTKALIVEQHFVFTVIPYEDQPLVQAIKAEKLASYSTPEETIQSHYSAMINGDYAWFMRVWSKKSQQIFEEDNKNKHRDSTFWKEWWNKSINGKELRLLNKVIYGNYVLVECVFTGKGVDKPLKQTIALKNEEGRWVLTQELADDPVLLGWNSPESRIKVISGQLPVSK